MPAIETSMHACMETLAAIECTKQDEAQVIRQVLSIPHIKHIHACMSDKVTQSLANHYPIIDHQTCEN